MKGECLIFYEKKKRFQNIVGLLTGYIVLIVIVGSSFTILDRCDNTVPYIEDTAFFITDPDFKISVEVSKENYQLFSVTSEGNVEDENVEFDTMLCEVASGNRVIDKVPLLYQTDYPNIKFSHGTVATSACGVSCASMAVSYLTNEIHTPGEFGLRFNSTANSNDKRMENSLNAFDVRWEKCFDFYEMKEKLKEGYLAIILVNGNTTFTSEGHFILAVGINEENNRVLINDPFKPNYSNYKNFDGYENGFKDWQITCGYLGCWLIEPKAEYQARINNID